MKPENHPEIWNDALEHVMPPGFPEQALEDMLHAVRGRRKRRYALRAGGTTAALFTAAMIIMNMPSRPLPSHASNTRAPAPETIEVRSISDEELLARFPQDSVVMVGTGNAKTLVFVNPETK